MTLIEKIKSKEEWLKTTAENIGAFQSGAALAFTATFLPKMTMDCFPNPRSEIDKEMRAMETLANQREATTYVDLRKEKWDINAITISAILLALPHCSGIMGYITYAQLFFDELEENSFSHRTPIDSVGYSGCAHFAVSLMVFRMLVKSERREVLKGSVILVTGGLVAISFFYFDYQLELHIPMQSAWLPAFAFSWLMGWYSMGCSIFPWVIMMELFAPLLVHNALVVMCLYFWSLYFVVGTLIFILIEHHFILGLLFVVFAVCCGLIIYFIKYRLIETDGKPYADIKTMLNK